MTTPARNVHETFSVGGTHCQQQLKPLPVGPRTCSNTMLVNRWHDDVRPASGNATVSNGFRLCRGWSHSGRDITLAASGGSWTAYYTTGLVVHRDITGGYWSSVPPTPIATSGNMINATLVKALNKVKSQDLHLGNFLAEGNKTVAMLASTASTILSGVRQFKRRFPLDWQIVRRVQRGGLRKQDWCLIPNSWLQLQYGWIPLMSDLYGGLNHLYRRSRFEVPFVRGHATSQDVVLSTSGADGQVGDIWRAAVEWEHQRKCTVVLYYKITNPQLAELSSLGLINPVEIVWELLPYSFVVDWLVPIGSWLSALTADIGMSFLTGSQSTKTKMRFKGSRFTVFPGNVTHIDGAPSLPTFGGTGQAFARTCYTSSPVPGLYVKSPISLKHAANSLALLAQAFR